MDPETTDPFAQVLPNVPEAVRKSRLLRAMHDKLASLPPGSFPFTTEFGRLRDSIAPQIGETRILFPEFTPHDESLHVVKLFELADKFFSVAYQQMTAAELFLLACALYAHDWGMAIGNDEKDFLRQHAREDLLRDKFVPLNDEVERLRAFARSEGLQLGTDGVFPTLSDDQLRLYARNTHARRSASRVREHFVAYSAVAAALKHLCEGHWCDFGVLDDADRFPREFEVAGETTNLLAITLQLRLIDLFHLTDDRTPYALWRFVAPKDRRSEQEWKKHRALNAVVPTESAPGRAIKVQGATEDAEVWAGLEDLRRYCENQVTRVRHLSARHVPKRYQLNFVDVDWAVTTGDLLPVDLAFSFDRAAMFRILSEDIYDGDPYVFLRELLQNSIDAIRTRRSRHGARAQSAARRARPSHTFDTTIDFDVQHLEGGDIRVKVRDYGIGMDEHVIRNYFTVAGISYYRSDEFTRQHLGFEPVSRFGIGILSCFMVAESLDVKTYRDPECGPPMANSDSQLPGADEHRARRLHLHVPSIERQFVVKDLGSDFEVGTEVELRVSKAKVIAVSKPEESKWVPDQTTNTPTPKFERTLRVTEFLSKIAGFVEFPIHVTECWPGCDTPRRTLIIHPDRDGEEERKQFKDDVAVVQLSRKYPWDVAFGAQAPVPIPQIMSEHCLDLKEIGIGEYQGWAVFPGPKNEESDFRSVIRSFGIVGTEVKKRDETGEQLLLRWDNEAAKTLTWFGVYCDGILVRKVEPPGRLQGDRGSLPPILMHVNIPTSESTRPSVSRATLKSRASWDQPIWDAVDDKICRTTIDKCERFPPRELWYRLGWAMAVMGLGEEAIKRAIPDDQFLTLWLATGGVLNERQSETVGDEIPIIPEECTTLFAELAYGYWRVPADIETGLNWEGSMSFGPTGPIGGTGISAPVSRALQLLTSWRSRNLVTVGCRFLRGVTSNSILMQPLNARVGPQIQKISCDPEFNRHPDVIAALQVALEDPLRLSPGQRFFVRQALSGRFPFSFRHPFAHCFAYRTFFNLGHPGGLAIARCLVACHVAERDGRMPKDAIKHINELRTVLTFGEIRNREMLSFHILQRMRLFHPCEFANRLFQLVVTFGLLDAFVPPAVPSESECVPDNWEFVLGEPRGSFGKVITEWPIVT